MALESISQGFSNNFIADIAKIDGSEIFWIGGIFDLWDKSNVGFVDAMGMLALV